MERIKNIRLNPIVKKDLRVLSRSMKIAWGLFAYEAVLLIVFLFAIWIIFEEFSGYGYSADYQAFVVMFPVISAIEFGIIALLMPIMTATAVSGEKERQTFDILLTTVMTPRAIIRGKVASAVIRVMVFMVGSIPLMALSFTLGGLSWINLFITMIAFLIFAILTGSLGIFASTLTTKSITGIILTYVFYFVYANASVVPTLIILFASGFSSSGSVSMLMLLNPVSAITQMFALMLGGSDLFGAGMNSSITGWIWVALAGAVMLGFSILFQELAARRIDPLHGYVKDTKNGIFETEATGTNATLSQPYLVFNGHNLTLFYLNIASFPIPVSKIPWCQHPTSWGGPLMRLATQRAVFPSLFLKRDAQTRHADR